ncbi:MAG: hypothetical protein AB9856_02400 [Cellulosilyticaceae bacterium]
MQFNNKPIETICKCNTLGEIIPLRIRLENDEHALVTGNITEIIYVNENNFAGIKTLEYGCKVVMDQVEHLLEIRYCVSVHKWTIRKVLY